MNSKYTVRICNERKNRNIMKKTVQLSNAYYVNDYYKYRMRDYALLHDTT